MSKMRFHLSSIVVRLRGLRILPAAAFAGLLFLCSCVTDHSEEAAERARAYAVDNLKTLSETQRHFVKYTQPEIYENVIFPAAQLKPMRLYHLKVEEAAYYPDAPHLDTMHACFVWSPPDMNAKIIVVGEGDRAMRYWHPVRVIIKHFTPSYVAKHAAYTAAADYARNSMAFLSTPELNRVRFSEPETLYTNFDVPTGQKESVITDWEAYMGQLRHATKLTQISLVWQADDPARKIVFTGYSDSGTYPGWSIRRAELMSADKLQEHTLPKEEVDKIEKKAAPSAPVLIRSQRGAPREKTGAGDTPTTNIFNR